MNRKLELVHVAPALLLAGGLFLAGCADNNYDLGNLNKTIAIGSDEGFALPGNNSTSNMILDDLLDLADNDVIQVASDGSYVFSRGADEDEVDGAMPVVDEIPLTQVASENDYDYELFKSKDKNQNSFFNSKLSQNSSQMPFYLMTLEDNEGKCKQIKIYQNS